jgi:hypothetical protein
MDHPHLIRITLELDPGEPIHGRLRDESGAGQRFHGWLELAAALERLMTAHPCPKLTSDGLHRRGSETTAAG